MLIVLRGLPGTGKTTIARRLARMLDAVHEEPRGVAAPRTPHPAPPHRRTAVMWDTAVSSVDECAASVLLAVGAARTSEEGVLPKRPPKW